MAPYQPRHVSLSGDPVDPASRRKVILVRTGLGLALVAGALAVSAVFVDNSGNGGKPSAVNQPGARSPHSNSRGAGTTTHPSTRAGNGHGTGTQNGNGGGSLERTTSSRPAGGPSSSGGPAPTRPGQGHGSATTTKGPRANGSNGPGGPSHRAPGGNGAPTINPASTSVPARALATPAGFGPLLRSVWVAADPGGVGLTSADVRSTYPGSVYYASQPSLGQYWSMSRFVPSAAAQAATGAAAGQKLLAEFNRDDVFFKAAGGQWSYIGDFPVGGCPTEVPGTVLAAWGICTSLGS